MKKEQGTRLGRRANLADLVILVVATAAGLAPIRDSLPALLTIPQVLDGGWATAIYLSRIVTLEPLLMAWTIAWLVLSVRKPRPGARRLARQAGFRICFAASMAVVLLGPLVWAFLRSGASGFNPEMEFMAGSGVLSCLVGTAVLAAVTQLLMEGPKRSRGGWLGWGGGLLGVFWIVLIPVNLCHLFWYNGWL